MAIQFGPISGPIMLFTASAVSGVGWLLSRTLQKGYIRTLERSLRYHAPDETSKSNGHADSTRRTVCPSSPPTHIERESLPFVIPMLAVPEFRDEVHCGIAVIASANVGQLADHLLDNRTDMAVRLELPELLAAARNQRAIDALLLALRDADERIRTESARALDLMRLTGGIEMAPERIYAAVQDALTEKADLQHVFTLLSVVLPREPLRLASESLNTDDPQRRGLALEYLETALPPEVAAPLLDAIEDGTRPELSSPS
jgi:hypothetical protein